MPFRSAPSLVLATAAITAALLTSAASSAPPASTGVEPTTPTTVALAGPTEVLVPMSGDAFTAIGHRLLGSESIVATHFDAPGDPTPTATTLERKTDLIDVAIATGGRHVYALWPVYGRTVTSVKLAEWAVTPAGAIELVRSSTLATSKVPAVEALTLAAEGDAVIAGWIVPTGNADDAPFEPFVAVRGRGARRFSRPVPLDRPSKSWDAADLDLAVTAGGRAVALLSSSIGPESAVPIPQRRTLVRRIAADGKRSAPIGGLAMASPYGRATMRVAISPAGELVVVDQSFRGGRYRVRTTRAGLFSSRARPWTQAISVKAGWSVEQNIVANATPVIDVDASGRATAVVPGAPNGLTILSGAPGRPLTAAATIPNAQPGDPLIVPGTDAGWPTILTTERAPGDDPIDDEDDVAPTAVVGFERAPGGTWAESGRRAVFTKGRPAGLAAALRLSDGRIAYALNALSEDRVLTDGYLDFGSLGTLAGPP